MKFLPKHNFQVFCILALAFMTSAKFPCAALPLETYASSSVLSEGSWVKISVPESGMYFISSADLQNWGFSDPSKVNVYGYGGQRLPDCLSTDYIDDLPIVQTLNTDSGIFFYGVGVESWEESTQTSGRYYHTLNPYSSVGYYYLSDREATAPEIPSAGMAVAQNPATTFNERLYHESNIYSIGKTGHLLLGEDFKYTPSQTFDFSLTDKDDSDNSVWMECSFVAKTYSASSKLSFTVNGEQLSHLSADDIASTSSSDVYGSMTTTRHTFSVSGPQLALGISYSSSVTIYDARLNYIDINYTRAIKLNDGHLRFWSSSTDVSLAEANASTHVWDVTDPMNISSMNTAVSGSSVVWENEYTGMRTYAAWNESASLPSPTFVKTISNQNLHSLETPDMVIFTVEDWETQAERLAELHSSSADAMQVVVVSLDEVYNEFSSGVPDANAFRKMLKMMWDRGSGSDRPLRFALFLGRMTYDNQHVTSAWQSDYPTIPNWQTDAGLKEGESYATDDMFAFLEDDSGVNMSSDNLCIGVGRLPVRSSSEAKNAVDKIYSYVNSSRQTEWKNQVMLVADDMNDGIHMTQSESMYDEMLNTTSGSDFFYNKVYIDAFTRVSNSYPEARTKMFRLLDDGVLWWNYVGHANQTSWTGEGILTYTDMNSLYLRNYPILYAATCDFLKWDGDDICGGEILFNNTNGGIIAAISATRQVYLSDNGLLTTAIGSYAFSRDDNGLFLPIGEIYRNGKNALKSNSNKLRYVLLGDPAMRFAAPAPVAVLESIDGEDVDIDKQITIKARQNTTFRGSIYDEAGNKMTGFNGIISSTLYDAEKSTTSNGYSSSSSSGKKITFEEQGDKLYSGRDSVINGEFTIQISMPSEISENFRPAAFNMYAYAEDGSEAIGCNRDFYVYGYDDTVEDDTQPPVIDYLYLNSESFTNNSTVNESPMVIASVTDDVGINLSSAGIGHQMTIYLDDNTRYTDVSLYYTPSLEDQASGTIAYPLEDLSDGNHSLRLKVWDTSGNSAESTIDFYVEEGISPVIYDVYTDVNPASTEVNFYLTHDRPDATMTVTITVYDLLGRTVWSETNTAQSDFFTTSPVTWDLCNNAGQRVQRGIYVYNASITTDGAHYATEAKKLAVTAQ